jgi:hypothetical protein
MKSEYEGNIESIRAVEDSIRATKKYTEGIGTIRIKHPIQGEDFPSRAFCKYYEVYPDTEISWDMPAGKALDWLWHDVTCIDVRFWYDYNTNKATIIVHDGPEAVKELARAIPMFSDTLAVVLSGNNGKRGQDNAVETQSKKG